MPERRYFVTAMKGNRVVLAGYQQARSVADAGTRTEAKMLRSQVATAADFSTGHARITHIAEQP